ncbi:MAG: WG repeat-containing protein, partial [Bacteroidota bacterium]
VLPIRSDGKWGIIDPRGRVLINPQYEQLGWPGAGSSLVVQNGRSLGLLAPDGQQLLPVIYEDIQVLDDSLFAVLDAGSWTVRNLSNQEIVGPGYEQLRRMGDGHIAYLRNGSWGLSRADGAQITRPKYDRIERIENGHFLLRKNGMLGLVSASGDKILEAKASSLEIDTELGMLFYKDGGKWGGRSFVGSLGFSADYDAYSILDSSHLVLVSGDQLHIYNCSAGQIKSLPIGARPISFSPRAVAYRLGNRIGLVSTIGSGELPNDYVELQAFSANLVRARMGEGWGLLTKTGRTILEFGYDYIGPLENGLAFTYGDGLMGVLGANGQELLAPTYLRIEREGDQIRAYDGEGNGAALTVFSLTANGELTEATGSERHFRIRVSGQNDNQGSARLNLTTRADRILPRHEWFYAAEEDRWGLRLRGGEEVIPPTFSRIFVDAALGITLVGLSKSTELDFERTTYRATEIFGVMLNEEGKVVTELNLLHLELDDWRSGNELARCVFDNGRYGLIDRQGRIRLRDATYIGEFSEGLAPVSLRGRLSGTLEANNRLPVLPGVADYVEAWESTVLLKDYTAYDQRFAREAQLICENCSWGYVSDEGELAIAPRFEGVGQGFKYGRAIVAMESGQGLINRSGDFVLEPVYLNLQAFPGNGDELVYRITQSQELHGLIDTLGHMRLTTTYDGLGEVSSGWVATQQGDTWGYYSLKNGQILPDTFYSAGQFVENLAPVKLLPGWTLINENGQQAWPGLFFDELGSLSEGVIWSRQSNKWKLLNVDGESLFELTDIERAYAFDHGVSRVRTSDGWGLINRTGEWVLRPRYEQIFAFQSNGRAKVELEGQSDRFGLIDINGQLLTTKAYRSMEEFANGLALVHDQNGFGFIDETGREVIPCRLGPTRSFSEGLAVFQEYGKCGYLDVHGNQVIEPKYSNCLDFNGGLAVVYETMSQAGLIDTRGTEVVEPSLNRH